MRAWLLKRQNSDIESASEMLHSALMSETFKKKCGPNDMHELQASLEDSKFDEKEAAILIQRTVRNWLAH